MKAILTILTGLVIAIGAVAQEKPYVPFFGNEKCPVTGKAIDKELYADHEGQFIFTADEDSLAEVEKAPEKWLAKAYPEKSAKEVDLRKKKPGPDEKEPKKHTITFQCYKLHFDDEAAADAFLEAPRKNLSIATIEDLEVLANDTCPVMEDEPVEPDIFIVHGKLLVMLCCESCALDYHESPDEFLKLAKELSEKAKKNKKSDG